MGLSHIGRIARAIRVLLAAIACICTASAAHAEGELDRSLTFKIASDRPQQLIVGYADFERLELTISNQGRTVSKQSFLPSELQLDGSGPYASLPLAGLQTGDVVSARFIGTHSDNWQLTWLAPATEASGWPPAGIAAAGVVSGIVGAAFIVSLIAMIYLRLGFIFWYGVLAAGMLVEIWAASGLVTSLLPLDMGQLLVVQKLGHTLIVVAAVNFTASFIEDTALTANMRKALRISGSAMPLVFALQLAGLPIDETIYYAMFFPPVVVLVCAILLAVARGSRWARYQLVGWSPPIVVTIHIALYGTLGIGILPPTIIPLFMAMLVEVFVTATGVTDRLMRIRELARKSAQLAQRDPLTGLRNRRAIETRFARLVERGYTQCALVDLDRFKPVNDEFGHAAGDEVLCAAARAMADCEDTLAVRMGGEEFLLLMKNAGGREKAETCRREIGRRIAAEVPQVTRPVTASVGLVDFADIAAEQEIAFDTIFARADALLYAAKHGGRDRLVYERMKLFERDPEEVQLEPART